VGEPVQVSRLWKNTREEVMWQNSKFFFKFSLPYQDVSRVNEHLVIARS
jgi:hypothetical protein